MKKIKVSALKIKRKMTHEEIKGMKLRNKHIDENKQMTTQQQEKIKQFESLFM